MSTLSTTNLKNPSSASNNIVLDSSGRTLLGSTFTGQSTSSPDGGGRSFRVASAEPGALFTSDVGTAGTNTGAQTAVASVGLSYFGAGAPTEFCITNGTSTVASNIRVYNNGSQVAQWTPTGNFQFNSGYGSVATAYGCRAWVNFNGTGTVAIRASGNVSSITDNGTGDYTVNFTTAMPDANYAVNISKGITATRRTIETYGIDGTGASVTPTTAAVRIVCFDESTTTTIDMAGVSVAIFR